MTHEPYAWEYVINKFRAHDNVLSTYDFISDIKTAAEYRRLLCDLKKKGFRIESFKATPRHWIYRLAESSPLTFDAQGQGDFMERSA
jgi:hypothetical protein